MWGDMVRGEVVHFDSGRRSEAGREHVNRLAPPGWRVGGREGWQGCCLCCCLAGRALPHQIGDVVLLQPILCNTRREQRAHLMVLRSSGR